MINGQFSVRDRGTVGAAFIKYPLGSSQAAPSTPRAQTPNIGRTEIYTNKSTVMSENIRPSQYFNFFSHSLFIPRVNAC